MSITLPKSTIQRYGLLQVAGSVTASSISSYCVVAFWVETLDINGSVISSINQGHPLYGNSIQMGQAGTHWQTISDFLRITIPINTSIRVLIKGRQTVGSANKCRIDQAKYSRLTFKIDTYPL